MLNPVSGSAPPPGRGNEEAGEKAQQCYAKTKAETARMPTREDQHAAGDRADQDCKEGAGLVKHCRRSFAGLQMGRQDAVFERAEEGPNGLPIRRTGTVMSIVRLF